MTASRRKNWWGEYRFGVDEVSRWQIGGLSLWMQRAATEWRVAYSWADEEDPAIWQRQRGVDFPEEGVTGERFAVQKTGGIVQLRALTPNRSVVARPRSPLRVASGHQTRVFVSTPLWVEVSVGPTATFLIELATRRLSDTWFGPSTREGQFAYALKTNARTRIEDLPARPYRFVTPVVIVNAAKETLLVERLNLPVLHLSIFGGIDSLWSEEVHMLRSETGDLAELDVRTGAPREAAAKERLSEPRAVSDKGLLFRAFSSLLDF